MATTTEIITTLANNDHQLQNEAILTVALKTATFFTGCAEEGFTQEEFNQFMDWAVIGYLAEKRL